MAMKNAREMESATDGQTERYIGNTGRVKESVGETVKEKGPRQRVCVGGGGEMMGWKENASVQICEPPRKLW